MGQTKGYPVNPKSVMNSSDFLRAIRKRVSVVTCIQDPLTEARRFIQRHGTTGEGRALRAIVETLWKRRGEFNDADIWSLSGRKLALVSALFDARLEGRYEEWEWHLASSYPAWRFMLDLHKKLEG